VAPKSSGEKTKWLFNGEKARNKVRQAYPQLLSEADTVRRREPVKITVGVETLRDPLVSKRRAAT
jgi:hypothetical protein